MAESNTPQKPTNPTGVAAESPTTAQPIDFDDDQQETGTVGPDGTAVPDQQSPPPRTSSRGVRFEEDEQAPPKPPRPMSPQQQAQATLVEAFPSIEASVIKAVLVASNGQVEPAFNALLSMSDPSFQQDESLPQEPPPPPKPQRVTPQDKQMQQDEMYARQLAAHYENRARQDQTRREQVAASRAVDKEDREYSFFDDDLPEIKENLRQGFIQTQTRVNKWISDFKKRIDGEDSDEEPVAGQGSSTQRQNFGGSQADQLRGIQKSAEAQRSRRSTDRDHYDADPRVISDNFQELELRDDEDETPPRKPPRPLANPDLFKPTPNPPQSGPVDEVEAMYRQPTPSGGKTQEWQPLTTVAPTPEADDNDNDPFSLGESDDDKDKDVRAEDSERLKKASLSKVASSTGEQGGELQANERSGSLGHKDKTAEDLLKGSGS